MTHIVYDYDTYGYTVQVLDDDGDVVYEYEAGNYRLESTTVVETWHQYHVKTAELRIMAKQTALEIAEEHNIDKKDVYLDRELRDYYLIKEAMGE